MLTAIVRRLSPLDTRLQKKLYYVQLIIVRRCISTIVSNVEHRLKIVSTVHRTSEFISTINWILAGILQSSKHYFILRFPRRSWSCQCPCGCGTVVQGYIITRLNSFRDDLTNKLANTITVHRTCLQWALVQCTWLLQTRTSCLPNAQRRAFWCLCTGSCAPTWPARSDFVYRI